MAQLLVLLVSFIDLVYEILWLRRLQGLFGSTAPASAVLLSALFLGLALGSACAGWVAPWARRPFGAVAAAQAIQALGALLVGPILALFPDGGSLTTAGAAVFCALLLPTLAMGATFPLLTLASGNGDAGGAPRLSGLYGLSLAGALLGTLAVPFVLLPAVGVEGGLTAALCGNLAIAAVALAAEARRGRPPQSAAAPGDPSEGGGGQRSVRPLAWALSFSSGALLVGLQALWTRMFSMVHESSLYSFSVVLALFLLGLAGGALAVRWVLPRVAPDGTGSLWGLLPGGAFVVASPRILNWLTEGLSYGGGSRLWVVALALLPAVIGSGTLFPLLLESVRAGNAAGRGSAVGKLLAANTLGAILGPLAVTFWLAPSVGPWWATAAVGLALLTAAPLAALCLRKQAGRPSTPPRRELLAAGATAALGLLVGRPWSVPRAAVDPSRGQELIDLVEGPSGTVAVVEDAASRWLTFNNHYTLGGTASTGDERHQGHLPCLLHPAPRKVLFLGLGTGITAGAALLHPVEQLTVVELLPEIAEAARRHFGHANYRLLEDPRTELIINDARSFVAGTSRTFDVIVGDLVTPWRPGESRLFTREHFEAARKALAPGGIYCQWLPLFQLTEDAFDSVAATFLEVFPGATAWRGDFLPEQPALALVGLAGGGAGTRLDVDSVDRRIVALRPALDPTTPYLQHPAGLWLFLIGPLDPRDPRLANAPRNLDTRPWVELHSPGTQLVGRGASTSALTREAFAARMRSTLEASLGGTWLEGMGPEREALRRAGANLWQASLLALKGQREESMALAIGTLSALPVELQVALTGSAVQPRELGPQEGSR